MVARNVCWLRCGQLWAQSPPAQRCRGAKDDAPQDEQFPEGRISALAARAACAEPDGPPCKRLGNLQKLKETFLCGLPEKRQVEVQIEDMEVAGLMAEVVRRELALMVP